MLPFKIEGLDHYDPEPFSISRLLMETQESMLEQAFIHHLGHLPNPSTLVGRLHSYVFPDGCTIFTCDGKPILQRDSGPIVTENFRIVWRYEITRPIPSPPSQ